MTSPTTEFDWHGATTPAVVDRAATVFANDEALVDGDTRLTFSQYASAVHKVAGALVASGVDPGDRVAIWAPNVWEWAVAAMGIHYAGAVLIPINTRFKGIEAAQLIEASQAKMLLCVTDFLDTNYVSLIREAGDLPSNLQEIVVLRGATAPDTTSYADLVARSTPETVATAVERASAVKPDDLCNILFTSGTTGAPKGAKLLHGPTIRAHKSWCDVIGLTHGDRYLIINPFFHNFGLNAGILACLMTGATIVPHPVFDVPSVMERIPEEQISMLPGPPAIYQTILNHPDLDSFDFSTLRLAVTGAAPIAPSMITEMKERLGFEAVVTGYGLTECHGVATMCRHDDDAETIATTSGRAIDDVEVLVVDDHNNEVPRGEPGEIVIRGYNITPGYLNNPEATSESIDADGWLHTGDIGVMDERGYIDITDRKKDMFIVGGFNAYPAEIEAMLVTHPDIAAAAVVGVPDERLGEVGMAFVVPVSGAQPSPDDLVAWSRETMANYKAPRSFQIVDEFPLNASGKVLKFELRERGLAAREQ